MRHSNISKVNFGASREINTFSSVHTRTKRARAHERTQSMPRIAWGRRVYIIKQI